MAMEGEKKRKREKCEYAKRHYEANKERGMEKKRENEGGMKDRGRDRDKKEDRKPKYYRDIKPVKILGVTTEPGDLHFYVEWDSGVSTTFPIHSIKIPFMQSVSFCSIQPFHCRWSQGWCRRKRHTRKFLTCASPTMSQSEDYQFKGRLHTKATVEFHFRLIWRDAPPKAVKEEAEISNGVNKVNLGETKSEEGIKTEDTEKTKVLENGGGGGDAPRAPTPVLHSYS